MLCTTAKYAKENPENCQKVINAVMKGQEWIQKHTDAGIVDMSFVKKFGK